MDFIIQQTAKYPYGYMTLEKNDNIMTTIFNLLSIRRGDFFQDPDLGLEKVKTVTPQNVNLQQQYVERALKPLLDSGRAKSIDVICEPDDNDINQINIQVSAIQSDGIPIQYQTYIAVGGPSATWTPV